MTRYLFVGAHPDDIELGAGATIAKSVDLGIECHTLVLSNCEETLKETDLPEQQIVSESREALLHLGVSLDNMSWKLFPVRRFADFRVQILQLLIDDYRGLIWDKVFIPSTQDIHQDHSVVSQEAMRAFKFTTMLGYELPWNNYESKIAMFNSVRPEDLAKKINAMSKFQTQSRRFYAHPTMIEAVLRFRGLQINVPLAEGFEVIRWIEK